MEGEDLGNLITWSRAWLTLQILDATAYLREAREWKKVPQGRGRSYL